jgi:hypothetical protein
MEIRVWKLTWDQIKTRIQIARFFGSEIPRWPGFNNRLRRELRGFTIGGSEELLRKLDKAGPNR